MVFHHLSGIVFSLHPELIHDPSRKVFKILTSNSSCSKIHPVWRNDCAILMFVVSKPFTYAHNLYIYTEGSAVGHSANIRWDNYHD